MSQRPRRHFGAIDDVPPGTIFPDRRALAAAGVHRPLQAGISGSGAEGADSIVLSGGYEDDYDAGDVIIYTGHGGNDPETGRQIADQTLTVGNLALAKNRIDGLPVRVVRGARHPSPYSPPAGYRYVGLYRVEDHWSEHGKSGFLIWRFRLVHEDRSAIAPIASTPEAFPPLLGTDGVAPRRQTMTVQRVVRSTPVARQVKELHEHRCQVCGLRLETPAGPYSEAAHIRPLGRPHDGPDEPANILCLCPNHHVLFDLGGLVVTDELVLIDPRTSEQLGRLRTHSRHQLSLAHIAYHRGLFWREYAGSLLP